jgi:hypothetical protein
VGQAKVEYAIQNFQRDFNQLRIEMRIQMAIAATKLTVAQSANRKRAMMPKNGQNRSYRIVATKAKQRRKLWGSFLTFPAPW